LVYKLRAEKVKIVEDFSLDAPRTREVVGVLNALGLGDEKVLLLIPEYDGTLNKSVRNLKKTMLKKAETASTRDLMNCSTLLFQKSAVSKLVKVLDHAA